MSTIDFSRLTTLSAKIKSAEEERARSEAAALLASTDWYVTRKVETGAAIPKAILDARKAARDTLSS